MTNLDDKSLEYDDSKLSARDKIVWLLVALLIIVLVVMSYIFPDLRWMGTIGIGIFLFVILFCCPYPY